MRGEGAVSSLRQVPVSLDDVATALEGSEFTSGGRIDLGTGEFWPALDRDYSDPDEEEDSEREWLWVDATARMTAIGTRRPTPQFADFGRAAGSRLSTQASEVGKPNLPSPDEWPPVELRLDPGNDGRNVVFQGSANDDCVDKQVAVRDPVAHAPHQLPVSTEELIKSFCIELVE